MHQTFPFSLCKDCQVVEAVKEDKLNESKRGNRVYPKHWFLLTSLLPLLVVFLQVSLKDAVAMEVLMLLVVQLVTLLSVYYTACLLLS